MTRRLLLAAASIALLAIAFVVIRYVVLRDTSTPVSVEQAIERAGQAPGGPRVVNGAEVPASGVYVYDTRGAERLEALLSTEHRYPPTTTITVRRGGCGVLMRWAPFEERQTEWDLCPRRGGWGLAGIFETHEFFGRRDQRRYACDHGIAFELQGAWRYGCQFEDTHDEFSGRFVGREILRVAGRPVETIHVRDRDLLSGHEEGAGTSQTWYRASDGLIVRRIVESRDRSPAPGGTATYIERYELMLRSPGPLEPR